MIKRQQVTSKYLELLLRASANEDEEKRKQWQDSNQRSLAWKAKAYPPTLFIDLISTAKLSSLWLGGLNPSSDLTGGGRCFSCNGLHEQLRQNTS